MRHFTLLFVALGLASTGCDSVEGDHFIPGEVVVQLDLGVKAERFLAYAQDKRLSTRGFEDPELFLADVKVPTLSREEYAERLRTSGVAKSVSFYSTDILRLGVYTRVGEAGLRSLLVDYPSASVAFVQFRPVLGVVLVPFGQEGKWVRRLNDVSFVAIAERNQRVYPRTER